MNQKETQSCFKIIEVEEEEKALCENGACLHQPVKSLFYRLGLTWAPIHSQTPFCKHDLGCLENILVDSTKSFFYAYAIRGAISLLALGIRLLRKNNKVDAKTIFNCFVSKESFRFGAFLGLMSLTLKGLICLLRRIRNKEDWKNTFFAGMLAGYLNLFFIDKGHRVSFATFLLARAFDACYNSLVSKGVIKKSQLNYVIIFTLVNAVTVYAKVHEPYLSPPSLNRFFDFVFAHKPMEKYMEGGLPIFMQRKLIRKSLGLQ